MALQLYIPGGDIQLSGNPIWVKVSGAVIPVGASNYRLLLKITSLDGLLLGTPFAPDAIYPDANGEALFDISGLVDQPKPPVLNWPVSGLITATAATVFNIRLNYGEIYILNSVKAENYVAVGPTHEMIILKGGVSDFAMCQYLSPYQSFFNNWINTGKFLTNLPDNQTVSPDQVIKLWFLSNNLLGIVPGKWNIRYDFENSGFYNASGDVDFSSFANSGSPNALTEFSVFSYPVDLAEYYATYGYVKSFTFWLTRRSDGVDISERRTFIVDNNYYENNNYLFVSNSFNCIDVLWLKGHVQNSIDITGTEGVKPKGFTSDSKTGSIVSTSRSGRRKWKINSGFKTTAEMEAMIEVYLAGHLWLLIDGKIIPVLLTNGDKLLGDTMEDLHSTDLELLEAHNTRFV